MKKFIIDVTARFCITAEDAEEALEIVDGMKVIESMDTTLDTEEVEKFPFEV